MTPIEIAELLRKQDAAVLGKLPEKKAARIILQALAQLRKRLDATDEGVVKVPGLGNFRIRQVKREKDGQTVSMRRVYFQAAKKSGGKEGAAKNKRNKQRPNAT